MRVISLVPSLTETLIDCGVEVVGRTRFCVHLADSVKAIPVVGGTKGVDWQKCLKLRPDLVIFDKEENTSTMAAECPLPWYSTHINSVDTIGDELDQLGNRVDNAALHDLAASWRLLSARQVEPVQSMADIPGVLEWLDGMYEDYREIEYIIWRDPWMAIGPNTFIASMMRQVGLGAYLPSHAASYPTLGDEQMHRPDIFYLFSSEPYPFARHLERLRQMGIGGALVDGESYSWFGSRSLRFLTKTYEDNNEHIHS